MPEVIVWEFDAELSPSANEPWYAAHFNRWKKKMRDSREVADEDSDEDDSGYPDISDSSSVRPQSDELSMGPGKDPDKIKEQLVQ